MNLANMSAFLTLCLAATPMLSETVKDREGSVRADRERMVSQDRWIYNDIDQGFLRARESGKPLLVVLRCIPCKACMGMDAGILTSDALKPLLDQFVCVRVINANTLDLSLFQFDYDLSFSTLFFNADRTVYGRFGSWQHQKDSADASLDSYKTALEGALAVHRGYPGNRPTLHSKQPGPTSAKIPLDLPGIAGKYNRELNWSGKVVQSCVHCHQIGDAHRVMHRNQGKPIPVELVYPMPDPSTVGLILEPRSVVQVTGVVAGSPAADAGILPGDRVLSVNGAPMFSLADMAWALHRTTEPGSLRLAGTRLGKATEWTLVLGEGWRRRTDISRRVGTWPMRAMALGGLKLDSLANEQRRDLKLAPGAHGLIVAHVGEYGEHAAAKKAGFRKGDVILELEGTPPLMTESQLIGHLLTRAPSKKPIKTVVLRNGERLELQLPQ